MLYFNYTFKPVHSEFNALNCTPLNWPHEVFWVGISWATKSSTTFIWRLKLINNDHKTPAVFLFMTCAPLWFSIYRAQEAEAQSLVGPDEQPMFSLMSHWAETEKAADWPRKGFQRVWGSREMHNHWPYHLLKRYIICMNRKDWLIFTNQSYQF